MTVNQKIVSCMTVLVLGVACAVAFVCFEPPYSIKFWLSFSAIMVSLFLFGAFWIQQIGKSDSLLPVSLGVWGLNITYLLFTLLAIPLTVLDLKYLILIHAVVFTLFLIGHLFFRLVELHVERISKDDEPEQKIEKTKVNWR